MFSRQYAKWMFAWETALTSRDQNRIVRPLEWGFDWLPQLHQAMDPATPDLQKMQALNEQIIQASSEFFGYETPTDFRIEERYPELFPTNVRPETLARDSKLKSKAVSGKLRSAEYLRFTSSVRTPYPENDEVNARWYPTNRAGRHSKSRKAMIVLPQWNADAFSHNALCRIFNLFGISCLRLSKPYHDIRRPTDLQRSDYACSANIGRTISACRQGVTDIRSSIDWLEMQGYEDFGVLGTSLGSCYAFIAAAHDPRIKICAFNHASSWFGDVVWTGQSTRHIRLAFEEAGLSQDTIRELFACISPMAYMPLFASQPKRVLVVHARYDLTFLEQFSLEILAAFELNHVDYVSCILPCGHYTTGETPYKYMDAWYLSKFVRQSFSLFDQENTRQA